DPLTGGRASGRPSSPIPPRPAAAPLIQRTSMAIRILINLARFAVTFLVATVVVFLFMRLVPGDPAQVALGVNASPELLEQTRREFGTDRPLIVQYFDWVGGLLTGDFGISYVTRQDISPLVIDRLQVSL